jgi:dipeptidyl aminopeptidase/acylaminoacyl peptidase
VDASGRRWPEKLVSGDDFYMQPAWHPRGHRVAWIAWNHPNMPWDGTFLRLGALNFNSQGSPVLEDVFTVAGGEKTSIFQPLFSPDGRYLAYVSDQSGWWQVYLYDLEGGQHRQLTDAPADHGLPAWVQGLQTCAFSPAGKHLFVLCNQQGFTRLSQIEVDSGREENLPIEAAYTWFDQIAVSPTHQATGAYRIALLASGATTPPRVITLEMPGEGTDPDSPVSGNAGRPISAPEPDRPSLPVHIWRRATAEDIPPGSYAPARPIIWEGMDGNEVHGLFFSPHNPRFAGIGQPPLIISIHGGPTSQVRALFNPKAQFFATRGYAVLEVNYRGSTGYGRPYWEALKGNWGIYDVQDAVSGARSLAEQGLADGSRTVIMGGSAGGFTVLQALEDYPGFFKAGVCLYGVANQFNLVAETHKFEARYSDTLLGPLPEAAELYRARSPIFHAEKIQDPIILFQGEEDQVVPRAQSDAIVAALRQRGIPHEYHLYPGEGHGFRKTETIEHLYNAIDKFLKQHVIFT